MKCEFLKKGNGSVLRLVAKNEEELKNLVALQEQKWTTAYLQTVYLGPKEGENMATIEVSPKECRP